MKQPWIYMCSPSRSPPPPPSPPAPSRPSQCTRSRSVQFSSVTQSCLTLCDPTDCKMPGLPVHHQLPEFIQTHVHWVGGHPTIPSSVIPFSSRLQSFPALRSFQMSQFFASGGQSTGVTASTSVLSMNISFRMDWLDLLEVQRTLKSLLQHHSSKASIF